RPQGPLQRRRAGWNATGPSRVDGEPSAGLQRTMDARDYCVRITLHPVHGSVREDGVKFRIKIAAAAIFYACIQPTPSSCVNHVRRSVNSDNMSSGRGKSFGQSAIATA